jgi:3-oxoadipate enol-lactonase
MGKSDVEVLCALYGLLRTASAAPYLSRIRAPMLGLYPSGGPITSREQEEQLAAGIPHMNFIHLPTRFHSILTIMPAACAMHVLYFAAEHDGIACHE